MRSLCAARVCRRSILRGVAYTTHGMKDGVGSTVVVVAVDMHWDKMDRRDQRGRGVRCDYGVAQSVGSNIDAGRVAGR